MAQFYNRWRGETWSDKDVVPLIDVEIDYVKKKGSHKNNIRIVKKLLLIIWKRQFKFFRCLIRKEGIENLNINRAYWKQNKYHKDKMNLERSMNYLEQK